MFRSLSTAVLLLLLALPGVALAQGTGTLAGRVLEADGVTSVIGATVRIEGTNLGARTNIDGDYRIIGVPIGTFNVDASFVGLESQTITGVDINAGSTRQLNFTLASGALSVDSIGAIVEYRVPLITNDAVGQTRTVTGEELENLPIRDVAATVALQGGVVNTDGSTDLNIRGGRAEEIQYYVDGVRVSGNVSRLGVNQQAIEQQEVLIGTIPARYGDVQSGVISITTKTGRDDFFGSVEGVTSRGLDSFGYNLGSISLGGPIVRNRLGFFLSAEGRTIDDSSPYGADSFQINDAAYDALQINPQQLAIRDTSDIAGANITYIPFPVELIQSQVGGVTPAGLTALLRANRLIGGNQTLASTGIRSGVETLTADNFDRVRGKNDPLRDITLNGNLNFTFGDVGLRLGAGYVNQDTEPFSYVNSLVNRESFTKIDRENYRFYGTLRQRLSNQAFYQLQAEVQDYTFDRRPMGFSSDVRDVVNYGRTVNERNDVANRYYVFQDADNDPQTPATLVLLFNEESGNRPNVLQPGTFTLPGFVGSNFYDKRHEQQYRFSGSATAQVGVNQIEFGGEFQQETNRRFVVNGLSIAQLADGRSYEEIGCDEFTRNQGTGIDPRNSYGYNCNGTEEVDASDQDVEAYFSSTRDDAAFNIAPYRPVYYAGYVQDKIEFQDLVVQLGLRMDVFDNNTTVLKDVYSPNPIVRAGDAGTALPTGIESDYAVYFNGNNVVGYRDLDGNFFNTSGTRVDPSVVVGTGAGGGAGRVRTDTAQGPADAFEDYQAQVTFMPRVGVSFPVTDRALFFASYNVTSQRPTEFAFAPISAYDNLGPQSQNVPNARLEPEQTTQYEIGFRQRLSDRSAVSLSGFYRTQENKVTYRSLDASTPSYSTFLNQDFTTTQGAEVNFDLRRTNNLQLSANYTLSFAQGTGSDAQSTSSAAFRGDPIPRFLSPSDFDQRHTANVTLDYRLPAGSGPLVGGIRPLENFGINLIGQFGSGQRYTRQSFAGVRVGAAFEPDAIGTINSSTLPASTRLDLRVDRSFDLGFSDSQLRAYLQVQNLLDTQNTLAVYRGTGSDVDGFAGTAAGITALSTTGRQFAYEQYANGPVNNDPGGLATGSGLFYSAPRQIRLGFLFDF